MSQEAKKIVQRAIIDSLKQEFIKASWWDEVQDDVKTRLNWLVEHVEEAGSPFANSFMTLLRWEFERRKLEGTNAVNPMASYFSTLMGMRISEEAYQCGFLPTRACLNLYDYVEPNDADVAACLLFCHKVEVLEKANILSMNATELTSPSEMAKLLRTRKKSTKPTKPIQEETVTWDDSEDDPVTEN